MVYSELSELEEFNPADHLDSIEVILAHIEEAIATGDAEFLAGAMATAKEAAKNLNQSNSTTDGEGA